MKFPKITLPQKPTHIKCASDIGFFTLFQKIDQKFENCFLFESLGEHSHTSRYSIIGFDPQHIFSGKKNTLTIDKKSYKVKNPYYELRQIIPQNIISSNYAGGLVGYLSYDAVNYFEPSLNLTTHQNFDQFKFGLYTDGLVLDKMTGEVSYFYYEKNRFKLVQQLLKSKVEKEPTLKATFLKNNLTKTEHRKGVQKIKQEIKKGNTFQCQLGLKSYYHLEGNCLQIYKKLREINPSPYMYYLKFDNQQLLGASPELLFKLQDEEMETYPLAGTINRSKTDLEDTQLARQLLSDPKERAEHNMLIDLHRNDIGRVAEFNSVRVRRLMEIKKFSHVQHISSEIVGKLKNGEDMFSALASNFPAGTLSGAPKIESLKIIDANEPEARGPYGGAVGFFGLNGDCTFTIPIRSLFVSDESAFAQTSGGIVYDSKPENEYQEIERKLAAMQKVLNKFTPKAEKII
ncbi:anthranilate synthase component I family protein [bacterium]|nr:anthranilate synthase component I family protein [bacterium]MBT3581047.1 anthranilate synthase component I family protein [bacterium]MBT7087565.1 anthranilate synthase component I family protein [bacterium]